MDLTQLSLVPKTKDEIRQRIEKCVDYFADVRAKELGINAVYLRQALPNFIFFEELAEPISDSALGAFNGGEYIVKINEKAVLAGKISVELIVLHEYTHALDELLLHLYFTLDDCMAWLRDYTLQVELPRRQNAVLLDHKTMMFAKSPEWKEEELLNVSSLLKRILNCPHQYFELDQWRRAVGIKQDFCKSLVELEGSKNWDMGGVSHFLQALHFQLMTQFYDFRTPLKFDLRQKEAFVQLKTCKPSNLDMDHLVILLSLYKGAAALYYGMKALGKNNFFDLPEESQLPYLCAEGEIRARREASRLLMYAIDSEPQSNPFLEQERYTLVASIKLEDMLLQWKQLRDSTEAKLFEESEERHRIECLIQQIAPYARTHKLIRRFYVNEELFLFCNEWNEQRTVPYSIKALQQIEILSGLSEVIFEDLEMQDETPLKRHA